jgi:glycosyltransferase involved in cell wall biosynthesis
LPPHNRILFVSTMDGFAWGGSEELWSQTALRLAVEGYPVSASLPEWTPLHRRVLDVMERGLEVWFRPTQYSLRKHVWHRLTAGHKTLSALELQRLVTARPPGLVVFSDGGPFPPIDLLEVCTATGLPFVTIGHANGDWARPVDTLAERYRTVLRAALRCYFVSEANLRLAEKQIGCELPRAEVVRNPFNVNFNASPPWPRLGRDDELHLACVARLEPWAKGQDILFEVLKEPAWATRHWRLHLYGDGPMRGGLERLAHRFGLSDRVVFEGHVAVEEIWLSNHVLVMPSRFEGLPLAIIEAMLCGRPVVATDVAGHAEVIEDGVTGFLADAPTAGSVANALERFWARRAEAEEIGAAASKRIRQLVPPDPVRIFSDKIKEILGTSRGGLIIGGNVSRLKESEARLAGQSAQD